jgi:hypothetical protein
MPVVENFFTAKRKCIATAVCLIQILACTSTAFVVPPIKSLMNDPIIAAAGDIACDPNSEQFNGGNGTDDHCRQKYTSDLLVNASLAAVLALGDTQYYCGSYVVI